MSAPEEKGLKLSAGHGADWWIKEIGASRKAWKNYRDRANKVIERYRDKRENEYETRKRFNILFSNTETLGPAIYSQVPVPDIRRRWQDKDPVGRLSALILQRSTQFCMEAYDFDGVLESCKQDYLLPGFATARVKYKPYIKSTPRKDESGADMVGDDGKPVMEEELVYEEAQTDYVGWDRFVMSRSRKYEKVWYVAFGDDLTKDEVTDQFGAKIAAALNYTRRDDIAQGEEREAHEATVRLWEVWCKRGRGRFIVAEGYADGWVLDPEPDPLRLEQFFPNAKPIWSIQTNNTLEPVPEYCEYQDQALELDDLTERIDILTNAVRRRGVYDAQYGDLASMLSNATDNNFVPLNNFASFIDKGGLAKIALEMPLDGLIQAIQSLEERRASVKQVIYEVTGIADIVRGSSNPNETATAQQIKGRWAGLRVSSRQKKFAQFARDLVRLKAEVIAERFDQETLSLMSGIKLPTQAEKQQWQTQQQAMQQQYQTAAQQAQQMQQQPPQPPQQDPQEAKFFAQPTWEEILEVLRSDKLRGFKIDIETDSTVQPDADAEKQARTELLQAVGAFARETGFPVPANLAGQFIAFASRSFKAGSQMEEQLEEIENANPGPTPQQQQKEQELQKREQALAQSEAKAKDEQHRMELAKKDAEGQAQKLEAERKLFDQEKRYTEQIRMLEDEVRKIKDSFEERLEQTAREFAAESENAVRTVIKEQGAMQ